MQFEASHRQHTASIQRSSIGLTAHACQAESQHFQTPHKTLLGHFAEYMSHDLFSANLYHMLCFSEVPFLLFINRHKAQFISPVRKDTQQYRAVPSVLGTHEHLGSCFQQFILHRKNINRAPT